jgi:pimeloyl-ACP methyl ester carboxylesterase
VTAPDGSTTVENPPLARKPKFDCFYVYPTVSGQPTTNADKSIDPEQIAIARYQAARYSTHCRVYAPIYRQLTLAAITTSAPEDQAAAINLAYSDVRAAWRDYLANHNNGRPFVLIGHSQGTGMLTGLLRKQIEPRPKVVSRMVSAILLGGNVTTKRGSPTGGSFRRVPLCERPAQFGCVIAFSAFNETPPDDTKFGRASGRFADVFGLPTGPDQEVACTNPADLAGDGPAPIQSLLRSEPFPGALGLALAILYGGPPPTAPTPWLVPKDRYTAECVTANEAHVLMVSPVGDSNPLHPSPDSTWGLHLGDANLPLGDLVRLVKRQAKAYARAAVAP